MATTPLASHASYDAIPRRSYITLRPYNGDIKSYATSYVNEVNVGTFSAVPGATAANCPQGAILHETGKKLYSGVQPGVSTYMVSVFDYANGLTGFIDPNGSAFPPRTPIVPTRSRVPARTPWISMQTAVLPCSRAATSSASRT
jgi:hypothetical protein